MERRFLSVELRAAGEDNEMIVEGYPIVYDQETNLGYCREKIAQGAATDALKRSNEFVLFNHDPNQPLARRANGTLEVKEDEKGVFIRADLSKSSRGAAMYEDIKNGLIDKMSFAFTCAKDTWEDDLRTVEEFGELFDYSPVTYPAYEQTAIMARSKDEALRNRPEVSTETEDTSTEEPEAESKRAADYINLETLKGGVII
jgi:HK97 family phage prohead protease